LPILVVVVVEVPVTLMILRDCTPRDCLDCLVRNYVLVIKGDVLKLDTPRCFDVTAWIVRH
jgi:hypothetical protein